MLNNFSISEDGLAPLLILYFLLVCMMGNTSFMVAQVLAGKGITAESLNGGINALSQGKGVHIGQLVRFATE